MKFQENYENHFIALEVHRKFKNELRLDWTLSEGYEDYEADSDNTNVDNRNDADNNDHDVNNVLKIEAVAYPAWRWKHLIVLDNRDEQI